nr:MAG TPA: major capsid protein [Caudoviricetes sp.]
MSKQLREMLNEIKEAKESAKKLLAENKLEEAKVAMASIKEKQEKAELLAQIEDDEDDEAEEKVKGKKAKEMKNEKMPVVKAFVQCFKALAKRQAPPSDALEVLDSVTHMTEGVPEDGGLTVPEDIQTEIKELRRTTDALELIVNVEPVSTMKGSRNIEVNAEQTPFDNVDEEADFPEVQGPQFKKIAYAIKKKGGILKLTKELLSDTAESLMSYINKWIAKKCKVTRNFLILKAIQDNFGEASPVTTIDDLKKIFNTKLDPALAVDAGVITNQDGFNYLDTLKDSDGNYILQKDPINATKRMLFGRYPVTVLSNKALKTNATKAPIYCGNFKEAITLFDREYMTIETSDQAGDMWGKDQVGVKVRERLDVQVVDEEAIVKGEITITP